VDNQTVNPWLAGTKMRLFGRSKKNHARGAPSKRRVVFVSHEATRTGAPKIILNILKHFKEACDIQCETVLQTGGHLATEFEEHSIVDCFNVESKNREEIQKRTTRLVNREKNNKPVLAICNSMETRQIAAAFASHGVPCVSLVHELPSSYSEEDYHFVFESSRKVVFPAHAVRDSADAKTPLPQGKSIVLSQGLLDPNFGTGITRNRAHSQIRRELSIPSSAFIVLGCGTLDLRKGIDHYAAIARQVSAANQSDTPIHFVWVGEGPRWCHSLHHYVELDLKKSKARNLVHFIGERQNVEPYFVGSDAFLMTSRVDPFPCVIHEAMATSLPIITFANSGGATEAIDNGAGIIVPYADYERASNVIRILAAQPEIANGLRERALKRVHSRFRFVEYGEKLIDLSESILGQQLRTQEKQVIQFPRVAA
jgi:glycosyltransferase involved in cell wall biosynthesis